MRRVIRESAAILVHHYYYGNPNAVTNRGDSMNIQKVRLANTQHMLAGSRAGLTTTEFRQGDRVKLLTDCDLSVDEGVVSLPKGATAIVDSIDATNVTVDLGKALGGKFILPMQEMRKYFTKAAVNESLEEANPTAVAPGRRVRVATFDPNIGNNRGPNSPGHGGYATLVGQLGEIQTIFGQINGVNTYKVNLVNGGQFVFGETELEVLGESVKSKIDYTALRGLGFGL